MVKRGTGGDQIRVTRKDEIGIRVTKREREDEGQG